MPSDLAAAKRCGRCALMLTDQCLSLRDQKINITILLLVIQGDSQAGGEEMGRKPLETGPWVKPKALARSADL